MGYRLNRSAVEHAKSLIDSHHYVKDSDWSEAQPSTDRENEYLEKHGWEEYGKWFLAIDEDANEETKDRYNFPYGDFSRLHRSGLIAAKQRAAEWDHSEIEKGAGGLLEDVPEPE